MSDGIGETVKALNDCFLIKYDDFDYKVYRLGGAKEKVRTLAAIRKGKKGPFGVMYYSLGDILTTDTKDLLMKYSEWSEHG